MAYCTTCGEEIADDAEICMECGVPVDGTGRSGKTAEPTPADSADGDTDTDSDTVGPVEPEAVDARDNWWHVVAVMPIITVVSAVIGGTIGTLLLLPFWLLFPVALFLDARYVQAATNSSHPNTIAVVLGSAAGFLTFGLLSWLVTPIYLVRRHSLLDTP